MSKAKKAGRRLNRLRCSKSEIGDVTLNDFANSSVVGSTGRMRKKTMNNVVTEVKQLTIAEDDLAWDERLDDLELPIRDEETDEIVVVKKPSSRRRKRTVTESCCDNTTGLDYPIDIWFLISEHIRPEDVGVFAAICKTSQAVVSTAKFWFSLYKRYYKSVSNLPEHLQPECMVRRYSLRACVIRALHFMYPPFINKLKPQMIFDGDPHVLTKRLCVLSWSQKIKSQWLFFFKLKQSCIMSYGRGSGESSTKPDLLEMLEDITANVDDRCKVLQVTCLNYTRLPMISGQVLSAVSMTLSQGLRHHRLQLSFGSGPFPCLSSNPIVLDPVVNVRVLDWWHPSFPHADGFNNSLCSNHVTKLFDELEF